MLMLYFNIIILICGFITYGACNNAIATIDLNFDNVLLAQNGLGWPSQLKVAKGNEALMKLRIPLANQRACLVTDPAGNEFDVQQPPNNRYQKWGDGCGIRVKNIKQEDEGRWRLTASKANDSIVGWIELDVLDITSPEAAPPISLQDGETHTQVALSSIDNAYCVVAKPFAESSLVPGQCTVTLDRTTRAVQGNWQVFLGLPGRVSEVQTKRHVTVQTERLDVGYVHDAAQRLHLYCNILHSNKEITFCRFQKTSNPYGYNVVDGLSDGSYSYFGDGFELKQCGITIEKPSAKDYATWRCSVGVQIKVGNAMQQQTPMQALISVTAPNIKSLGNLEKNEGTIRNVFVQKDSPFTISCNAGISLRYCWFQHPNGTQFTPVRLANEEQLFWYTGESLEVGECGITFAHSNESDSGKWSCFMGPKLNTGIEMKDQVEVRVTGPLAANLKEVPVIVGENATLYCKTSNGRRALKYCRFLSPQLVGMSVDSSVTPENAILDRFFFTTGRDLNFGDCSLSITSVQEEDIGTWTCAAVVDNEILESRDSIRVFLGVAPRRPRLQAGIIGTSAGLSVLVVILIGYVTYKRGWIQRLLTLRIRRATTNTEAVGDYAFQSRSSAQGSISSTILGSVSSGSSEESVGASA
ncbi:jg9030 [Pararge aegeria aegeria]|uniref:Jg9030 protein n=1 Tax=Pararge aegeria aegeria TaxID=348720 RepID=A0A8S4RBX8_9NEOP|nr:jg9030 [Pararge aegeria aegeria]